MYYLIKLALQILVPKFHNDFPFLYYILIMDSSEEFKEKTKVSIGHVLFYMNFENPTIK